MPETTHTRQTAARAFVRSLNILLKFARMYDFGHPRTAKQYETAWSELQTALGSENEAGLLLAVSGEQLLLDGTPLESAATERSFARMLSSAGIASIHFSPRVEQSSLARLVRGFPTSPSSKPEQLSQQLKAAMQGDPSIHVNEVCFVPADSAVARSTVAAQLAARTMGFNSEQTEELLHDPEKLLQLIVAAEGARGKSGESGNGAGLVPGLGPGLGPGPGGSVEQPDSAVHATAGSAFPHAGGDAAGTSSGPGTGNGHGAPGNFTPDGPTSLWANASSGIRSGRPARGTPGSMTLETGLMTLQESELQGILQVLAQIGRNSEASGEKLDANSFQSRISVLPRRARFTVSQALSALAAQAPADTGEKPTLMRLAEHIAVRFALESYERGDVKVNAVLQLLEETNQELASLRKVLGTYEDRMTRAGMPVRSHVETLAEDFWSKVSTEKVKLVLESQDAWCVPAANIRTFVEGRISGGEPAAAEEILRNYAAGIRNSETQVRRQTAIGIAELGALYAKSSAKLFANVIRDVGLQLAEESDPELQSFVSAAFVRLSQEALQGRAYPAMQRSVELMEYMDIERPDTAKIVRPRIGVEDRLSEFIEESIRAGECSLDLQQFLRRLPLQAAENIANRFGRSGFREDSDLLVSMMNTLGDGAIEHLRAQLLRGDTAEALDVIGILARMDCGTVEQALPARMKDWKRATHDRVVRQIAASGTPHRAGLLLRVFDSLDHLIRPMAVDEMGMCGETSADGRLLRIAEGDLPPGSTDYLQLKAIEALGRLRSGKAETLLRKIVESRKTWRWAHPAELRIAAAQALQRIEPDWVRSFLPRSGLSVADLTIEPLDNDPSSSAMRQRRYPRLRLDHPVPAATTNLRENCRLQIRELALGGGVATSEQSLHPGSVVDLRLSPADRTVKAQAIVRDANTHARAFEVVDIDLEERAKLRKLLVHAGNQNKESTPRERKRSGVRTILSGL